MPELTPTGRDSVRPTIADVARLAGVSIKTVSRVANNEPNVRAGTRERVLAAIHELNYRPNLSARSLASRRSYLIGLLYGSPSASYIINIQDGALLTCRAEGYDLLIHPCYHTDPTLESEVAMLVSQSKVDGLILTPPLSDMLSMVRLLDRLGLPFIRIAPPDVSDHRRAVFTNDRSACAEMTRYLLSLGHRRIAFIRGHPDHGAVGHRYDGYLDALAEAGIAADPQLVGQGHGSFESGVECAQRLLDLAEPPTAIFASNDDMATGVMRVAHERGLAIPADLSVAGFDDIPLASQLWPALTTIRQPIREMAGAAARLLTARLKTADAETDGGRHVIDSSIVVRESTGPAPAGR